MEVAETKEHSLDSVVKVLELVLGEEGEGSHEVSFNSSRRLICQFNRLFEQVDWDTLIWISGKEESKLWVRSLTGKVSQLLLHFIQIPGHKMDVLEHNPVSLLVSKVKFSVGDDILSLTKSDLMKVLDWIHLLLDTESLHIQNWISSWRQDEENWNG